MSRTSEHSATSTGQQAHQHAPTIRQAQVLWLVAAGWADKEIAERLGISASTVRKHVGALLRRYEAPNRAAVITIADACGDLDVKTGRAQEAKAGKAS